MCVDALLISAYGILKRRLRTSSCAGLEVNDGPVDIPHDIET
jgi:hypothetical protein